jgi:hypothetical protein
VRHLFIVTAVLETATGVLLLLVPAVVFAFLFGWRGIGVDVAVIGRLAGAALFGLGIACWRGRDESSLRARSTLLVVLLVYNVVATVLLAFAGVVLSMIGLLLWPAVVCHVALTVWSINCLRRKPEGGT